MTAFALSSLSAGLALVLLWIVVVEGTKSMVQTGRRSLPGTRPRIILCVLLLAGVLSHAVLARATIPAEFDFGRFGLSYVYLVVMLVAAVLLVHCVTRITPDHDVQSAIRFVLVLLSLNAVFGLTGLQFLAGASSKQTGLFSEPSHLALVVAPVLVYLSATRARHHSRYLLGFLLWALAIQNLTMIVAVALAYAVGADFKPKQLAIAFGLLAVLLAADIPYFADRLSISEENSNLSVLVFLQGWQNAFLLLEQSMGVGGGFQQFGLIGEFGELTERIYETSGVALNLYDGGTTASKLIGEFGYAGFVLLAAYGYAFVRCVLVLRNKSARERLTSFDRFTMACLISYAIEIGVRGVGYFSPGTFLFFVALINLQAKNVFFPRNHAKENFRRLRSQSDVGWPIHHSS